MVSSVDVIKDRSRILIPSSFNTPTPFVQLTRDSSTKATALSRWTNYPQERSKERKSKRVKEAARFPSQRLNAQYHPKRLLNINPLSS